jgi:hypothetical protein
VYVHIGGKIEALGEVNKQPQTQSAQHQGNNNNANKSNQDANGGNTVPGAGGAPMVATVCIIDVRDNKPADTQNLYNQLQTLDTLNFSRQQASNSLQSMNSSALDVAMLPNNASTSDNSQLNSKTLTKPGTMAKVKKGRKSSDPKATNPGNPELDEKRTKTKVFYCLFI